MATKIVNYLDGEWLDVSTAEHLPVINPATTETVAEVLMTPAETVASAVDVGTRAFVDWRATPATERVQPLFKLKMLLEEFIDSIARTITIECGKTYQESIGEMRRGIENVEVACGMPSLMQGTNNEDIARGIDEIGRAHV